MSSKKRSHSKGRHAQPPQTKRANASIGLPPGIRFDARTMARVAEKAAYRRPGREHLTFDPVVLGTNFLSPTNDAAVAISASGYITPGASAHVLNQVPQNNTSTGRVGRKMKMTKVRIKGTLNNSSAFAGVCTVRLALVYIPKLDRTTTTMPPQTAIWTTQHPNAMRVLNNSDRYKVIREFTFKLIGPSGTAVTDQASHLFDEMIDVNRATAWTQADTTGSFDNMEEGALCLYSQSTSAIAVNSVAFNYSCRLYYED